MPTKPIEQILVDPRCQARAAIDHATVAEYADLLRVGVSLGEVDVFDVGGELYLVDGFHRRAAHIATGSTFLVVRVVGKGTIEEAIWYATAANVAHGLRRTNADKRRAVELALESGIGVEQSNRALAVHVGVSDKLVADVREEWEAARAPAGANESHVGAAEAGANGSQVSSEDTSKRRQGRDGKSYPASKPERARHDAPTIPPTPPPVASQETIQAMARGIEEARELDALSNELRYDPDPLAGTALADAPPKPATATPMPAYGPVLERIETAVRSLRLKARTELPPELNALRQRVESGLRSVEQALLADLPVVCPACEGEGCVGCAKRGWLDERTAFAMRKSLAAGARP